MKYTLLLLLITPFSLFASDEPTLLDIPPRIVTKSVFVEITRTGYEIHLDRKAAEMLKTGLALTKDNEENLAGVIRDLGKNSEDVELKARLEVLAIVTSRQMPNFRKSLDENFGDAGVTIKVIGVQKPVKERPLLKAIVLGVMPEDIREKTEKLLVMAKTTPLYWKIEAKK